MPKISSDSGEEVDFVIFAIFTNGGHLGYSTWPNFTILRPWCQVMLHVKFESYRCSSFIEEDVRIFVVKCWQTKHAGCIVMAIAHYAPWARWAKNQSRNDQITKLWHSAPCCGLKLHKTMNSFIRRWLIWLLCHRHCDRVATFYHPGSHKVSSTYKQLAFFKFCWSS